MRKNKHRDITLEIRRRILSGKIKPEEQLPTRMELERKFKVSRVTIMMCIGNHIPWNIPPEAIKLYLDLSSELAYG